MAKPNINTIPEFYKNYVMAVEYDELIPALINGGNAAIDLFISIPEKSADYSYAAGKWSIRELIAHMIDAERVFAYRALWFARNDKSELPGFDENEWARDMNIEPRKLYKLIAEYNNLRASTIDLFESLSKDMLERSGNANGSIMTVNAIGFIIAGHEKHHLNILQERYFS